MLKIRPKHQHSPKGTPETAPKPRIAYWIFNYQPKWEAASKELATLSSGASKRLQPYVFNLSTKSKRPRLFAREMTFPLPYCLVGLPFVKAYASRFAINHLFASPAAPLLASRLPSNTTILTVTKDTPSLRSLEKNAANLRRLRYIVVESERHRELLRQIGVEEDRLQLIYPGAEKKGFRPASGKFKILFATSPMSRHDLLSRGVRMLIRAARHLANVEVIMIWREAVVDDIRALIQKSGVTNVRVVNGYIPVMEKYYDEVHATILPGLDHSSLKPCPHSFLDSLAHGKPVLVSEPTSVAGIVQRTRCGVVFPPTVKGLTESVLRLEADYEQYSANCHSVVERMFCPRTFLDKYHKLYASVLQGT